MIIKIIEVYHKKKLWGYLNKDKWDVTEDLTQARIFNVNDDSVDYTAKRLSEGYDRDDHVSCKVVEYKLEKA